MELIQYFVVAGILCYYDSLRNHKSDSRIINFFHSVYLLTALLGFAIGVKEIAVRNMVLIWLSIPLVSDIIERYSTNLAVSFVRIFKKKPKKKSRRGAVRS